MTLRKIYLSTLVAGIASAAITPTVFAEGFSVGVDIGRTEAKKYCEHITNCEKSDTGGKIDIGYTFNKNFSMELGYTSFGTIFDSKDNSFSASQDSRAITLSVLGAIPITDFFSVYGRAGYANYQTDSSGAVQGVVVKDRDGYTPVWGAGVKFDVSEKVALRVEYENYSNISRVDGHKDDVQGLYGGVAYNF